MKSTHVTQPMIDQVLEDASSLGAGVVQDWASPSCRCSCLRRTGW